MKESHCFDSHSNYSYDKEVITKIFGNSLIAKGMMNNLNNRQACMYQPFDDLLALVQFFLHVDIFNENDTLMLILQPLNKCLQFRLQTAQPV